MTYLIWGREDLCKAHAVKLGWGEHEWRHLPPHSRALDQLRDLDPASVHVIVISGDGFVPTRNELRIITARGFEPEVVHV